MSRPSNDSIPPWLRTLGRIAWAVAFILALLWAEYLCGQTDPQAPGALRKYILLFSPMAGLWLLRSWAKEKYKS